MSIHILNQLVQHILLTNLHMKKKINLYKQSGLERWKMAFKILIKRKECYQLRATAVGGFTMQ